MSNAMTFIITADEGVMYTSHRKISPDMLIKQWMKAETLLSFIKITTTLKVLLSQCTLFLWTVANSGHF